MTAEARARTSQSEWETLTVSSSDDTISVDSVHTSYTVEISDDATTTIDVIEGGEPGQEIVIRLGDASAGLLLRDDGESGNALANIRLASSTYIMTQGTSARLKKNPDGSKWEQVGVGQLS